MKLLTKGIEQRLIKNDNEVEDPLCIAKFFNPNGTGTWFAIDYNPETRIFFGYTSILGDHNDELGDFSLDDLEAFKSPFGLGIERDLWFTPTPLSEIKAEYTRR